MEFKETEFGTEIIGLDKELRQVGREGLLELEIERLRARITELEARKVVDTMAKLPKIYEPILLDDITSAVREADEKFKKTGGSSRHWVDDLFLECLSKRGLQIFNAQAVYNLQAENERLRNTINSLLDDLKDIAEDDCGCCNCAETARDALLKLQGMPCWR